MEGTGLGGGLVCVIAAAQGLWLWLPSWWAPSPSCSRSLGTSPAAAPLSTPAGLEPALGQRGVCTEKVLHTWRQDNCRFPLLWAQLEWCVGKGCRNPSAAHAAAVGVVLALTQPSARACCRPSQSPLPVCSWSIGPGSPSATQRRKLPESASPLPSHTRGKATPPGVGSISAPHCLLPMRRTH